MRALALILGLALVLGAGAYLWLTPSTDMTHSSSSSSSSPDRPVRLDTVRLTFPGATGWTEAPGCTEVEATDPCVGQWVHSTGQVVQVLLVPVPDAARLAAFQERFVAQVNAQGGVAGVLQHNGQQVVRALQPMRTEDASGQEVVVVGITYALTSPDGAALHLVTSRTPLADEEAADGRVRDLLAFGAWTNS